MTPEKFLPLGDSKLKEFGFSRQKAAYARNLAQLITGGRLDLDDLANKPDAYVNDVLTEVKGIGRWTTDIYLLMALHRKDIWPQGDLALVKALEKLKKLPAGQNGEILAAITGQWKPWRSVAARILWHYYLNER